MKCTEYSVRMIDPTLVDYCRGDYANTPYEHPESRERQSLFDIPTGLSRTCKSPTVDQLCIVAFVVSSSIWCFARDIIPEVCAENDGRATTRFSFSASSYGIRILSTTCTLFRQIHEAVQVVLCICLYKHRTE
jgi:hypothetical protein